MYDPVAVNNRSITGVETLMWGNDYPHPEGTWPHSAAAVDAQFAGVPDDEVRAIVAGNAPASSASTWPPSRPSRRPDGGVSEDVGTTRGRPEGAGRHAAAAAGGLGAGGPRRIDSMRPDGLDGDVQVVARAAGPAHHGRGRGPCPGRRRLRRGPSPPDRRLLRIDHPDARLAELAGRVDRERLPGTRLAAVPDEAERSTLLNLLLDDLTGANLVAGYAMQRHPSWTTRTIPVEHFDAATDLLRRLGQGRHDPRRGRGRRHGADAHHRAGGARADADDPLAWHDRPALPPGSMRRARRLDLVADGDGLGFDVHFRDTTSTATAWRARSTSTRCGAGSTPRPTRSSSSTPPPTCCRGWSAPRRSAAPSRLVGATVDELRAVVRADFVGTSTCTHLNDTLRGLADLPALAATLGF